MIRLERVSWVYPHAERPSISGLDLQITPGEFVILCGASGSGKSTALKLMNGLIPHFHDAGELSGSVTVNGIVTAGAELDEIGLSTGTVLQHPRRQFFADSADDEIAFAMENLGFPPAEIRARVAEKIDELAAGIPHWQPLQRLSGGQQQQVALAASTAHGPRVLLLDEPSSNLSADAVARLVGTLTQLKARGVTIVVAEHRLRYLHGLVDRVIVMRDGTTHLQWSAQEFARVTDAELAREGLRGAVRTTRLPALPATGRSVDTTSGEGVSHDSARSAPRSAAPSSAPASGPPAGPLELRGVRCRLGGRVVLDIERAVFHPGEVTAIRGQNGTGKSTLARIITGLQRSEGSVTLGGRSLSARARGRLAAIVMQDVQRQLFTESAQAEIDLAAVDAPAPPDTREVLRALDLAELAERHPLSLSGGQQQRLVVAAVRVSGRRIVIFDEPSSGVDRRHLQSISDQIRQLAGGGAVVLLISHDEDLLALAADRQLTLRRADLSNVSVHARRAPDRVTKLRGER